VPVLAISLASILLLQTKLPHKSKAVIFTEITLF